MWRLFGIPAILYILLIAFALTYNFLFPDQPILAEILGNMIAVTVGLIIFSIMTYFGWHPGKLFKKLIGG